MAEAREIAVGDVVTYRPVRVHLTDGPETITFYVLKVHHDDEAETLDVRGGWFPGSAWAHLHRDELTADHPVTITRVGWSEVAGAWLVHIIDALSAEDVTLCGARRPSPLAARLIPRRPVCRSCGYAAVKAAERDAAALAEPFAYRLPADPGVVNGHDLGGRS